MTIILFYYSLMYLIFNEIFDELYILIIIC